MKEIDVTFLGTSDSIPTAKRNHSAIFVEVAGEKILVDCGEGTQRQLRIAGISPTKIDRILITHWHEDHFLGLPGLFKTLAMMNYSKTLRIYGPKGTKHFISLLESLARHTDIKLEVYEVSSGKFINKDDFLIEAKRMVHGTPTNAYSIILKDKIRIDKKKLADLRIPNSPLIKNLQKGKDVVINGKKIKSSSVSYVEKGKKLTIILDTAMNQKAIELARNSDVLISESSFSVQDKDRAKEYRHLTSEDAATIAKEAKVKKLILTHISQRYESNLEKIKKEAKKIFKNVFLAKDFDKLKI